MFKNIFFATGTLLLLLVLALLLPLDRINWGRVSVLPAATITVTGTSESQVANEIASFGATISEVNADKDTAVNSVNTKMTTLINSLKDFGIPEADIQTQSVSVYQIPEDDARTILIYPPQPVPPQQTGAGDWQASNSISITLRDVSKASALTDILNKSGATNVYGPNLTVDSKTVNDSELLAKAVEDAKTKAETIAKAGGRSVGKMINVQESGGFYPKYAALDSASSIPSPIEPGTSTLTKSVTVVFELK